MRCLAGSLLLVGALWPASLVLAAEGEARIMELARVSGCTGCHQVDRQTELDEDEDDVERPSVGPAWREVAARYKAQAGAEQTLLRIVLQGSQPGRSHWNGKAMGLAMPANRVAITEPDARTLVRWILSLEPADAIK